MNMYLRLLINDFRKRAWKNLILFVFMCLSVTVAAVVVLMLSQLFTSITDMYETANPPHFLQMHMGDVEQEKLEAFNESYDGVQAWQCVPMIDLYGGELTVEGADGVYTLSDCRLDISLVKQNDGYDVMLDDSRRPLALTGNEIGVPVILLEQYQIAQGDRITVCADGIETVFTVQAYVYDGMMNSTMCSSTRFLISDEMFDTLLGQIGETEHLIETWFADSAQANAYQSAYEQSELQLPKNGQAITYTMIFLLSALTDLMTAMVLVLAGVLMLVIAVICMRYVLLAELEDDVTQIGTMKAIGIPERSIRRLYLTRIGLLLAGACVCGPAIAVGVRGMFTGHVSRMFGEQPLCAADLGAAAAVTVVIAVVICLAAGKILGRLRKRTIVDLLVLDRGFGKSGKVRGCLHRCKRLPFSMVYGWHEAKRGYGVIFWLLLLVTFLIFVPVRTYQTMQDETFVTCMGSPVCDLQAEVLQGSQLEERKQTLDQLCEQAEADGSIQELNVLRRVRLQAYNSAQEPVGVHMDTGAGAGSGIAYLGGRAPENAQELALSVLLAEELGCSLGDTIVLQAQEQTCELTLCGIYQDVTSGGRTAKCVRAFDNIPAEKYTYQMKLSADAQSFADTLRQQLGSGYSVEAMEDFLDQTLGGVTARMRQSVGFVWICGLVLTVLIAVLFMELRLARTMPALAQKHIMGIPTLAMCLQELYPILLWGICGALAGTVFGELMGASLIGGLFSMLGLGLQRITFSGSAAGGLWIPAALVLTLGISSLFVCRRLRPERMDIRAYLNQ